MPKTLPTHQPVTPELIASWRTRISHLDDLIQNQPAHQWRWLWQIRRDILAHLLHRHAGDALPSAGQSPIPALPPPSNFSAPANAGDTAVDAYIRSTSSQVQTHVGVNPPREGSELRNRLKRLQAQNEDRYALVTIEIREAQQRIYAYLHRNNPFYPPFFGLTTLTPEQQQKALAQAWTQAILVLVAQSHPDDHDDSPLTEDEILRILMGDQSKPLPADGSWVE
jgi:hypothetical protein